MAQIKVTNYIDIGTGGPIDTTRYQFSKNSDFTKIIDDITKTKAELLADGVLPKNLLENLLKCTSPLPKLSEDGDGFYMDLENLYCRYKLTANGHESEWFEIEPVSQVDVEVKVRDGDHEYITTSKKLGWS